jgi:hypothetical protein
LFDYLLINHGGSNIVHKSYTSLQERDISFVNRFIFTLLYEEMTKIKIIHLDESYNFIVTFPFKLIYNFKM